MRICSRCNNARWNAHTFTTDYGGDFCSINCAFSHVRETRAAIVIQRWIKHRRN
jgi:hypothetical protein